MEPGHYFAVFNRAYLLERLGELQGALAGFTVAADLAPADWAPPFNAGIALLRMGRPVEAAEALTESAERAGDPIAEVLYARSIARRQAGDFAGAAQDARAFRAKALDLSGVAEDASVTVEGIVAKARRDKAHADVSGAAMEWAASRSGSPRAGPAGRGKGLRETIDAATREGLHHRMGQGVGGQAFRNMVASSEAAQPHAALLGRLGQSVALETVRTERLRVKRSVDKHAIETAHTDYDRRRVRQLAAAARDYRPPLPDGRDEHKSPVSSEPGGAGRPRKAAAHARAGRAASAAGPRKVKGTTGPHAPPSNPMAMMTATLLLPQRPDGVPFSSAGAAGPSGSRRPGTAWTRAGSSSTRAQRPATARRDRSAGALLGKWGIATTFRPETAAAMGFRGALAAAAVAGAESSSQLLPAAGQAAAEGAADDSPSAAPSLPGASSADDAPPQPSGAPRPRPARPSSGIARPSAPRPARQRPNSGTTTHWAGSGWQQPQELRGNAPTAPFAASAPLQAASAASAQQRAPSMTRARTAMDGEAAQTTEAPKGGAIRPAPHAQAQVAATAYASGRVFAPSAIRPNELTATTASLIARCMRLLPHDPLRQDRKRLRLQRRQEAMKKARAAVRTAREGGNEQDVQAAIDAVASDSHQGAGQGTSSASGSTGHDAKGVNAGGTQTAARPSKSRPVAPARDRRRSAVQRDLPQAVASRLGVRTEQGLSLGGESSRGKAAADFSTQDIEFLVSLTRGVRVFASLPLHVHQRLCRELRFLVVPARKVVYRQGKASDDRLFIIVQGGVDVHMRLGTARKTRNRRIRTAILAHRWVKAFRSRARARDRGEAVPVPLASMVGPGEGLRLWTEGRGVPKVPAGARADGGILPAWAGTMMQAASGRWDARSQADGLGAEEVQSAQARVDRLRAASSKTQEPSSVMAATAAIVGGGHTGPADQLTGMLAAGSGGKPLWLDFLSDDEEDGSDIDEGDSGPNKSTLRPLRGGGTASGAPQTAAAGTSGHASSLGTLLGSLYAGEAFGGEVLVGLGHSASQGGHKAIESLASAKDSEAASATAAAAAAVKMRRDSAFGALGGRIGVEFKDFHRTVMPPAAAARAAANRDAVEQESGELNARHALLAQAHAAAAQDAAADSASSPAAGSGGFATKAHPTPRFRRVSVSTREDSCILTLSREAYQKVLEEVREAMVADVSRFLARVSLFESLTKDELRSLAERIEHRRLRSGQLVVSQGDRVQGLFFLRAGRCSVRQVVSKASAAAAACDSADGSTAEGPPLAGADPQAGAVSPGRRLGASSMASITSSKAGTNCTGNDFADSDSDTASTRSFRTETESQAMKRRKQSFQSSQRFAEVLDSGMADTPRLASPKPPGVSPNGMPASPVRAMRSHHSPGSTRRHSSSGFAPGRADRSGALERGKPPTAPGGQRGRAPAAPARRVGPAAAPDSPHRLQTRVAPSVRGPDAGGDVSAERSAGARVPFARGGAASSLAEASIPAQHMRPAAGSPRPRPRALSVDTGGSHARLQVGGTCAEAGPVSAKDAAATAGVAPAAEAESVGSVPSSSIQRRGNPRSSMKHENPRTARAAALRRQRAEEEEFAVVQSQMAASLPIDAIMPVSTSRARGGSRLPSGPSTAFAFGDDALSVRSGADGGQDLEASAPHVLRSGIGARQPSRRARPSSTVSHGLGTAAGGAEVPATPSAAISSVPLGVRVQAAMLARERRWKAASRTSRYGGVRSRPAEHVGPSPHGAAGHRSNPSDGTTSGRDHAVGSADAARPGATAMLASHGGGAGPLVHLDREEFDSRRAGQRRASSVLGRPAQAHPAASASGHSAANGAEAAQATAQAAAGGDAEVSSDVLELGTLMPGDCFGESVALSTRPSLLDKSNRALLHRHAQSLMESGVALGHLPVGHPLFGMSHAEVQALATAAQEPHGLPGDIIEETRAPASVLCETAVEVLLLRRKDLYDCLPFQSRQKVREAAMAAPANRSVTTSGQRLAWQRFREKVAAEARSGSAAAGRHAQHLRRLR